MVNTRQIIESTTADFQSLERHATSHFHRGKTLNKVGKRINKLNHSGKHSTAFVERQKFHTANARLIYSQTYRASGRFDTVKVDNP